MGQIKYTKTELRTQQVKLTQLQRYLPTLRLKKAMLQAEITETRAKALVLEEEYAAKKGMLESASALLLDNTSIAPDDAAKITSINKKYENVAGVEVPRLESVSFAPVTYNLFETPPWVDGIIILLRNAIIARIEVSIIYEQLEALEKELREVSIRVNLFEKVLIPRTIKDISMIKIFLSDQFLASVARAKVAKKKIEQRLQLSMGGEAECE